MLLTLSNLNTFWWLCINIYYCYKCAHIINWLPKKYLILLFVFNFPALHV